MLRNIIIIFSLVLLVFLVPSDYLKKSDFVYQECRDYLSNPDNSLDSLKVSISYLEQDWELNSQEHYDYSRVLSFLENQKPLNQGKEKEVLKVDIRCIGKNTSLAYTAEELTNSIVLQNLLVFMQTRMSRENNPAIS